MKKNSKKMKNIVQFSQEQINLIHGCIINFLMERKVFIRALLLIHNFKILLT